MKFFAYFGSTSNSGIFAARYDGDTGQMDTIGKVADIENPSFLALHPSSRYLYAVSEVNEFEDQVSGGIVAYSIDAKSGALTRTNSRATGGTEPCHVELDARARMIAVANYRDGSVTSFLIQQEDGGIGARSSHFKHEGSSIHQERQGSAHAHGCSFCRNGSLMVATDLGTDRLYLYRVQPDEGTLRPEKFRWATAPPGSGPRHFVYHPNGRDGYTINELTATISRYSITHGETRLTLHETVPTLDENFHGENTAAEISIDKSGQFLYSSNRGADEIVVFKIAASGQLEFLQRIFCGGKSPRHFALDPGENHLVVNHQESDTTVVFRRDAATGMISDQVAKLDVATPTCVVFADIPCLA